MRASSDSGHGSTVPSDQPKRTNLDGGRPPHPAIVATEALVEALTAIIDDRDAMEHAAHANVAVARTLHERALRLRDCVEPEIRRGYGAAEAVYEQVRRAA